MMGQCGGPLRGRNSHVLRATRGLRPGARRTSRRFAARCFEGCNVTRGAGTGQVLDTCKLMPETCSLTPDTCLFTSHPMRD